MRRRLRKKLRVREFTELGFEVWGSLGMDLPTPDAAKEQWTRYREETITFFENLEAFLHQRGLCSGGSVGSSMSLVVSPNEKQSASEGDREAVAAYLRSQPEVTSFVITGLVDVHRGSPVAQTFGPKIIKFERDPRSDRDVGSV